MEGRLNCDHEQPQQQEKVKAEGERERRKRSGLFILLAIISLIKMAVWSGLV